MSNKIPLCIPYIGKEEKKAVKEVLESGWMAYGPYNKKLEKKFAEYIGVKYAITMNSCTSALHLAIEANNITKEVLVPSFTFVASVNAIITGGAKPVFVDIDQKTYNMDIQDLKNRITSDSEAIMPVHYGGQSCNMDKIMKIAKNNDLLVIEDSAETIGGSWDGKKTGSFGIGCFSFFPTKNMTTGEGGILTLNGDELAEKIRALVGHGITSTTSDRERKNISWFRSARFPGYNFRMSNLLAAVGYYQLQKLDEMNERRRQLAEMYNRGLEKNEYITTPFEHNKAYHVYQMYVILVDEKINRDDFVKALNDAGIGASVHFYPPVHQQYYYKENYDVNLPITEEVSRKCVTLPMFPQMKEEQINKVVNTIKNLF